MLGEGRELYYSLDVVQTVKRVEAQQIYNETYLTSRTCYNDSDYKEVEEIAEKILPRALRNFLALLIWNFPAIEEVRSPDYEERLAEYLREIIGEEEEL